MRSAIDLPLLPCRALLFCACSMAPLSATVIILGAGGTSGFNGVGDLGQSFNSLVGPGISLTITASGCATPPCIITSSVTGGQAAGLGFGVHNSGGATDGSGLQELGISPERLTFLFSVPVVVTGFGLEDVDPGNGVVFSRTLPTASTISSITTISTGAPPGSSYSSANATYTSQVLSSAGTEFTFSAGGSGQGIRVRSLSFEAIPEPATYSLLGLGIGPLLLAHIIRQRERSKRVFDRPFR